MDFNHWDIILAIPLAWAAFKGFRKGLVIELASIAALIAGIYLASNFSNYAAALLDEWVEIPEAYSGFAAFLLTFIAVVFGVYALAKVVEKAVNIAALKLVNKLAGLLFGTLKMVLIISVVLNVMFWVDQKIHFMPRTEPENSLLFRPVLKFAPGVVPVLMDSQWLENISEDLNFQWVGQIQADTLSGAE